jgi:quinol monooxygenase YgiN
MITQITRFTAKDHQSSIRLNKVFEELSTTVPTEPGNVSYTIFTVENEPRTSYIIEAWESPQDADKHAERVVANGLADVVLPLLTHDLVTENLAPLTGTVRQPAAAGHKEK